MVILIKIECQVYTFTQASDYINIWIKRRNRNKFFNTCLCFVFSAKQCKSVVIISPIHFLQGFHPNHKVIRWFWQAVHSFDNEQRLRLLQVRSLEISLFFLFTRIFSFSIQSAPFPFVLVLFILHDTSGLVKLRLHTAINRPISYPGECDLMVQP